MPETTATPTLPSYLTAEERRIAEKFPRDVAKHQMEVLHGDGLYRHLRCSNAGGFNFWFEVITWPGSLAIRGDMGGGYIFSRVEDMFQFFRSRAEMPYRINPSYWAEKLPDCGRSVEVHSETVLRAWLDEALTEHDAVQQEEYQARLARYEDELARFERGRQAATAAGFAIAAKVGPPTKPQLPTDYRKLVAEYEEDDRLRFEDGARELLGELERAGVVSDPFEWSLTDYDWPFLWACHAIVWAIDQYDRVKAGSDG